MEIKAIITGSTGMVGKGVLLECLESEHVAQVLLVNRKKIDIQHPKIQELIVEDFSNLPDYHDAFQGYNACFHCMGVSAVGKSEAEYTDLTFGITETIANLVFQSNPDSIFIYVSGTGTDSSEKGAMMWARVKGKTENMLLEKGFKKAYMFRPGMIIPEKGVKSATSWYNWMYVITRPLFPVFKLFASVTTSSRIGQAMIHAVIREPDATIYHNKELNELAKK